MTPAQDDDSSSELYLFPTGFNARRCTCNLRNPRVGAGPTSVTKPYEDDAIRALGNKCPSYYEPIKPDPAWVHDCDNNLRDGGTFFKEFMCVEISNVKEYEQQDAMSLYYPDSASSDSASSLQGFQTEARPAPYLHTESLYGQNVYKMGELILSIVGPSPISAIPESYQNFAVPSRDLGGGCAGIKAIQFLQDVSHSETECVQRVPDLETACVSLGVLDAKRHHTILWIAKAANAVINSENETATIESWAQAIFRMAKGNFVTQVAPYGAINEGTTDPVYINGVCRNTLRKITYDVEYIAATGTISSVNVSAVVQDLAGTGATGVKQGFAVRFYAAGSGSRKAQQAPRSGVPGYRQGAELVAGWSGFNSEGKLAIYQAVEAASVAAAGTAGACSISSKTKLRFNNDMKSSCSISLTRDALRDYCNGVRTAPRYIPPLLQLNFSYVGKFGNANPIYTGNWTEVIYGQTAPAPPENTAKFDESTGKCQSLVTGLRIEIIYGLFGQVASAQEGIFVVQVYFDVTDWTYPSTATGSVDFHHRVTVTYHKYNNGDYMRMPHFTPITEGIPDDIWHPFYPFDAINSAKGSASVSAGSLLLIVLTLHAIQNL